MKILIGADLVPTKRNISLFESGNAEELLGKELADVIRSRVGTSVITKVVPGVIAKSEHEGQTLGVTQKIHRLI